MRRRLTLAVSPEELGEEDEVVWSTGSPAAATQPQSSSGSCSGTWERRSESWKGSRFWALGGDASSDEEEDCAEVEGEIAVGSPEQVSSGKHELSMDRRVAFSATQKVARLNSVCVAGAPEQKLFSGTGKLDRRSSQSKGWKGPLPPVRSSPKLSLGDIWAMDVRAGKGGRKVSRI